MGIEEKVKKKFHNLLDSGEHLRIGNESDQIRNETHRQDCIGWLTSARNLVHLIVNIPDKPYRAEIDRICNSNMGFVVNRSVGEVLSILENLAYDIDLGLISSIENQTKAIIYDDFLDHAKAYYHAKKKNEAGVIAGVVFEDTLRTICRNNRLEEKDNKLDLLIDELANINVITKLKAKRAKVAAHVRTKATHAQWDEFSIEDVKATIEFTEELIKNHLDNQ